MFLILGISLLIFDNSLYQNPKQKSLYKNTTDIVNDKIEQMDANATPSATQIKFKKEYIM